MSLAWEEASIHLEIPKSELYARSDFEVLNRCAHDVDDMGKGVANGGAKENKYM